jgi:cytochrome c553
MKPIPFIVTTLILTAGATLALAAAAPDSTETTTKRTALPDKVQAGRDFVHQVGMCIDCHSPRNERGEIIIEKDLMGAPIGFAPLAPMPWAPVAPPLAGLPAGYTEQEVAHFLSTGERPHGLPPVRPPMPGYRLSQEQAEAVAAYLASLAPHQN